MIYFIISITKFRFILVRKRNVLRIQALALSKTSWYVQAMINARQSMNCIIPASIPKTPKISMKIAFIWALNTRCRHIWAPVEVYWMLSVGMTTNNGRIALRTISTCMAVSSPLFEIVLSHFKQISQTNPFHSPLHSSLKLERGATIRNNFCHQKKTN